jgi:hypothetical protein
MKIYTNILLTVFFVNALQSVAQNVDAVINSESIEQRIDSVFFKE